MPPTCNEFEEVVLSSFINQFDQYSHYMFHLTSEMFYNEKNAELFNAILELSKKGFPIDIVTITEEIRKRNKLELFNGPAGIMQIAKYNISIDKKHVFTILEYHLRRKLAVMCGDFINKSYDLNQEIFDNIDSMQDLLSDLTIAKSNAFVVKSSETAKSLDILMFGTEEEKMGLTDVFKHIIKTGWKQFDSKVSLTDNKIIEIAGPPKHGKSKFVQAVLFNMLDKCDIKPELEDKKVSICWYTAEETNIDLGITYASSKVFIKPKELKILSKQNLPPEKHKTYKDAIKKFGKYDIDFISGSVKMDKLSSHFKNFIKNRSDNFNILVIDNFLSLDEDITTTSGEDALWKKILKLKHETRALIFVIHHFRKESRQPKEIADTGAELSADSIKGTEGSARVPNTVLLCNQINMNGNHIYPCYEDEYKDILERLFIVNIAMNRDDDNTGDKNIRFFANLDFDYFVEFDNLLN